MEISLSFSDIMTAIQAVILFLGLGATVFTLFLQNKANKRLATLNLIIHQRSDEELNNAIDLVFKLATESSDFDDLSQYLKNKDSSERKAILKVLNYREFVAVGINKGIIDEEAYKQAYYSVTLRDWRILQKTIISIRNNRKTQTLFQDFELLVSKWKKKPLKTIKL